jgi:hypothetical protein
MLYYVVKDTVNNLLVHRVLAPLKHWVTCLTISFLKRYRSLGAMGMMIKSYPCLKEDVWTNYYGADPTAPKHVHAVLMVLHSSLS